MTCSSDSCGLNMARIHLAAGDLVGAYRQGLADAEAGDPQAIELLAQVCERAGDAQRAAFWRSRLPQQA